MYPQASNANYQAQQRLTVAAMALVRREWARMGDDFDASWQKVGPRVLVLTASAQLGAARTGVAYMGAVLDETGVDAPLEGAVVAESLAGVASDGRPLDSLLFGSVTSAKTAVGGGADVKSALAVGGRWLEQAVHTQVADAGRNGAGVSMNARPRVTGYVRQLNLPSCSRCAVFAGRWFPVNTGFQRHPGCFPAGVVVSGPSTLAATRRWYQGELSIIHTASGQQLPATGNHPILTDRGWLPASLLQEGDYVVRSTRSQGAGALIVPDEDQVPASIEDVWRSDSMTLSCTVPSAAEDFHGDGGHGQVDVVLADCLLWRRTEATFAQLVEQVHLTQRIASTTGLTASCAGDEPLRRLDYAGGGAVGGSGLGLSFAGSHAARSGLPSSRRSAYGYALLKESGANRSTSDAEASTQGVLALAGQVGGGDVTPGQDQMATRWDAPAGPLTLESRAGYASRGEDLRVRLAGQVEMDRVVELRRVEWSGHVYNLTSAEGWYNANGLIVSNCDCQMVPSAENRAGDFTTDPLEAIRSGQVTGLSKADTKAILEDGANPSRVINIHREGMPYSTDGVKFTREAAGRRPRLMPEAIYKQASSREDAIRLLKLHRYIT